MWAKGIVNEANIDVIDLMEIPFTHRGQSFARLNFVR